MFGVRCSGLISNPGLPISSAGLILGAFALLGVSLGARLAAEEQGTPSVFAWKSSYAEALEAALEHGLLVAVYFRPVVGVEPPALARAARTRNLGRLISGVKVGPAEVLELRERFAVSRFPALVVLDARETVLLHWQETIPPDVWKRVARTFRQLEESYEKQDKDVEIARELFEAGRADVAYRRLRPLLRSRRTAAGILRSARELETRIIEAGEERILVVLAAEGLLPDERVGQRLRELFAEPLPPRLKEVRDRELLRLETMAIGGRSEH